MSLILAIESDAGQAGQLANIAQQLRVELVVVKSTGEALKALGGRAPDLVLVPALLSPREDTTLADTLRTVAGDMPVRLLIKPLLSSGRREATGGLMANLRKKKRKPSSVPDGCAPETFAEQIAVYLGEASEQASMPVAVTSPAQPPAPTTIRSSEPPVPSLVKPPAQSVTSAPATEPVPLVKPEPVVEHVHHAVPWPLAASSLVVEPLPPAEPPAATAAELPVWPSLESLLKASEPLPVEEPPPLVEEPTPSLIEELPPSPAAAAPREEPIPEPLWMPDLPQPDISFDPILTAALAPTETASVVVVPGGVPDEREWRDLAASFQRAVDALRIEDWLAVKAARVAVAGAAEPAEAESAEATASAKPDEAPCDEWGFYDPARYGLSAVLSKIDRMDGSNKNLR